MTAEGGGGRDNLIFVSEKLTSLVRPHLVFSTCLYSGEWPGRNTALRSHNEIITSLRKTGLFVRKKICFPSVEVTPFFPQI
jgi:hypothetical protein